MNLRPGQWSRSYVRLIETLTDERHNGSGSGAHAVQAFQVKPDSEPLL